MKLLIESGSPSLVDASEENELTSSVYAANQVQLVLRPQKDNLIERAGLFQSQIESLSNEMPKLAGIISDASVITHTNEPETVNNQAFLD